MGLPKDLKVQDAEGNWISGEYWCASGLVYVLAPGRGSIDVTAHIQENYGDRPNFTSRMAFSPPIPAVIRTLLALSGHGLVRCTCLLLTQSGHSACASGCLLSGGSGHDFLTSLVANALAYFLSGLRFGDDVAS